VAITLPDDPRLASATERRVWAALGEQLGEGDLVIAGQRVTDHLKDHEIDFLVAIEGAGIVCVEVKGGEVTHDGRTWRAASASAANATSPAASSNSHQVPPHWSASAENR